MIESPYRHIENPPEEKILQRMEEIFLGEKKIYATKFIATSSYGFGHITRRKNPKDPESEVYTITVSNEHEPLIIEIIKTPSGISLEGFKGWKGSGKRIDHSEINNIINEITLNTELKTLTEKISNDPKKRLEKIKEIQKNWAS